MSRKPFDNKNIWVIGVILALAALLLFIGVRGIRTTVPPLPELFTPTPEPVATTAPAAETTVPTIEVTDLPTVTIEDNTTAAPQTTAEPAAGYILLTIQNSNRYWLPLPAEGEFTAPIVQPAADGSDKQLENYLHITPTGMYMESANCDSQDCVHQGEVTLENKDTRILYNMIICLPNQVVVELYTPDEIMAMMSAQ